MVIQRKQRKAAPTRSSLPTAPHQLRIAFDSLLLRGINPSERSKVVSDLASLLLRAAGVAAEERDDDRI